MRFHWGKTKDTGVIKFGPIATRDGQIFKEHPIEEWYGVSGVDARWFFGFIRAAPSRSVPLEPQLRAATGQEAQHC
jgi:hypothetical protein